MAKAVREKQSVRMSPVQTVIGYFRKMERNREISTVEAVERGLKKSGTPLTRHQVIRAMQSLEKTGAGEFKVGRRGYPSRFHWAVPLTEWIAKKAKGGGRREMA